MSVFASSRFGMDMVKVTVRPENLGRGLASECDVSRRSEIRASSTFRSAILIADLASYSSLHVTIYYRPNPLPSLEYQPRVLWYVL